MNDYKQAISIMPEGWTQVTKGYIELKDRVFHGYTGGQVFKDIVTDDIGKVPNGYICVIRKDRMTIPKGYHKLKKGKIRLDDQVYNPTRKEFVNVVSSYGTVGMPVSSFMCVVRKRIPNKNGALGVSFKDIVRRIKNDSKPGTAD